MEGINNFIDLSAYKDGSVKVSVKYSTDTDGEMKLFFTTDLNENYVDEKVSTTHISGTGMAEFIVPVTEYTRLRLDIPEGSTVTIHSLKVSSPVTYIDYGYDNSMQNTDENGNVWNSYDNGFHTYDLAYLPNIWADNDSANNNTEYSELLYTNGAFEERYQYNVTLSEGTNEYIIRISNDYYWYCDEINAIRVSCDGFLYDVNMRILEGD